VIAVKDTTNGGTLYVATTGEPYPIEVIKNGSDGGQIAFDSFNQPVRLTPPSDAIASHSCSNRPLPARVSSPSGACARPAPSIHHRGLGECARRRQAGSRGARQRAAAFATAGVSRGDVGILRLLSAAEISLEADVGQQSNELCGIRDREAPGDGRNKAHTNALTFLDSSTPTGAVRPRTRSPTSPSSRPG
jgi:hypothetical protein